MVGPARAVSRKTPIYFIVTALECKLQLLNIASQVSQMPRAPTPEKGMHALTMGENGSSCSSE